MKINLAAVCLSVGLTPVFADQLSGIPNQAIESAALTNQVESTTLTQDEMRLLKKMAEKEKLAEYSGVLGTAPAHKTITSAGSAIEELPSGPDIFAFWSQTLANGFYYEGRIYGKYNMRSQNPAFPDVPASAENNPPGGKFVVKLGYNFQVTSDYDITPYLRLEAGKNWSLVYADTNGDFIHSTNYAILPGFKQTFLVTDKLTPYIDIYGGFVQVNLNGTMTEGANAKQNMNAGVQQFQLTTEIGFAYKITDNQAIIPYTQFVYTANNPDAVASASYNDGGFNISALSSSQQVYAVKYSYSW